MLEALCWSKNTYLLTPWNRVLLEKLTGFQPVWKFPAFYRTRSFITVFTSPCYLYLSWARSIQSIPSHSTSSKSISILSSHLCLGLLGGLFPSGFPTKTLYTPLLSPVCAICPSYLILLYLIARKTFGDQCRSLSSSLCSLYQSPVTSSLSGPNISDSGRSEIRKCCATVSIHLFVMCIQKCSRKLRGIE